MVSSKTKTELAGSTDPKIPLYAEMASIRRIDTKDEAQEMLRHNYQIYQFSSGKKCDIIDSSQLKDAK